MGELGADESPQQELVDDGRSLPVKDAGSQAVDLENSPDGRRVIVAIKRNLSGKGPRTAQWVTPFGSATTERFVTVESPEGNFSACLQASSQGPERGGDKPLGNAIVVVWFDRQNQKHGRIRLIDRPARIDVEVDVTDIDKNYFPTEEWDTNGGMDCYPRGDRDITAEEIGTLADQLESAQPNQEMTEKAMKQLMKRNGAKDITDQLDTAELGKPSLPELETGSEE